MKKLFKRNQLIITTLAIMIAVAGYLNFAGKEVGNDGVEAISDNAQKSSAELMDLSEEDLAGTSVADGALEEILVANEEEGDELPVVSAFPEETDVPDPSAIPEGATKEEEKKAEEILEENESPGEAVLTTTGVVATARLNREQVRSKNREVLEGIISNSALTAQQKEEAVASMVKLTENAELETAAESLLAAKGFADVMVSITDGSVDVVVNQMELTDAERAQIEDIVKRKTGSDGADIVIMPVNEESK